MADDRKEYRNAPRSWEWRLDKAKKRGYKGQEARDAARQMERERTHSRPAPSIKTPSKKKKTSLKEKVKKDNPLYRRAKQAAAIN